MLRAARLLLVASAAASIGVIAVIVSRASALSPLLLILVAAAALFALAAVELERDAGRGRLLAAAGASALAGIGTLAGFGAGDVTFPAAALGVLAAWAAAMWRTPRWVVAAFVAYVVAGVVLSAPRLGALAALPWLLPSVLVWPVWSLLGPATLPIAVYGAFGLAIALAAAAYARRRVFAAAVRPRAVVVAALAGGVGLLAIEVVLALARPGTSARDELAPVAVAVIVIAGALLAVGVFLLRSGVAAGLAVAAIGGALVAYIVTAQPTVECRANGASTTSGPWWLPSFGGSRSSGAGGGANTSGRIDRDDGVTITYECSGGELVRFEIRR